MDNFPLPAKESAAGPLFQLGERWIPSRSNIKNDTHWCLQMCSGPPDGVRSEKKSCVRYCSEVCQTVMLRYKNLPVSGTYCPSAMKEVIQPVLRNIEYFWKAPLPCKPEPFPPPKAAASGLCSASPHTGDDETAECLRNYFLDAG